MKFRFRAWDASEKQMVTHEQLIYDPDDWIIELINCPQKGDVLMLWTGLKDKNGKEIFEGDVVKWRSTYKGASGEYHIDQIKWEEFGCFMIVLWSHVLHAAEMEVIGNIYENPELLEKKGE